MARQGLRQKKKKEGHEFKVGIINLKILTPPNKQTNLGILDLVFSSALFLLFTFFSDGQASVSCARLSTDPYPVFKKINNREH